MMNMCGGSRSTSKGSAGGGRTVQVRGYTRANGTYVAGYTRSLPGSGSAIRSRTTTATQKSFYLIDTQYNHGPTTSGKRIFNAAPVQAIPSPAVASLKGYFSPERKTVYVRGYMKSNGTYVAGYMRSLPSRPKGSLRSSSAATTCSNGSYGFAAGCYSSPTNPSESSGGKVVHVRGYTRSDGTHMASYRSLLIKSSKSTFATVHPMSSVPMTTTGGSTHQVPKYMRSPMNVDHELHPIHTKSGSAKPIPEMQSARDYRKKEKEVKPTVRWHPGFFDQQPLLDTTNTRPLPSSRVQSEPKKFQSKVTFEQHSPPLDVGAKCNPSGPHSQTAVEGSISRLAHDSNEFSKVAENFRKAWAGEKRPYPAVNFIFKVTNNTLEQKWMAYKSTLQEKDVKELYHGTKLSCKITTSWKLCETGNCGICGISRSGLDPRCIRDRFQRFGNGFYLAPNSSKCHDYTQSYNGFKAILMCDVLPGRKFVIQTNRQHLQSPPTGYDSVYGNVGKDLNYPELVVYKPEAVLPRYIIVYRSRRRD